MSMLSELPLRQERFVTEYLVDLNGASAARRAGYSPKAAKEQASRLLTKTNVKALIQTKCRETEARLQVTRDDVIRGLLAAYQDARQRGDPSAMIRAYREIGLMLGYYTKEASSASGYFPREHDSTESMSIRMQGMTDSELLSL